MKYAIKFNFRKKKLNILWTKSKTWSLEFYLFCQIFAQKLTFFDFLHVQFWVKIQIFGYKNSIIQKYFPIWAQKVCQNWFFGQKIRLKELCGSIRSKIVFLLLYIVFSNSIFGSKNLDFWHNNSIHWSDIEHFYFHYFEFRATRCFNFC